MNDTDPTTDGFFNHSSLQRRDTFSSKAESEGGGLERMDTGSERMDTCRICRSEGSLDEPLFYPCKCSGSIKFVHQDCLMEWLSHSNKKHCELCKTPFRFTKLYDANMPQRLPWMVFVKRACWHVLQLLTKAGRGLLVALVWLGVIPWVIRWVWRWFFWVADAAWAREAFMSVMQAASMEGEGQQLRKSDTTLVTRFADAVQQLFRPETLAHHTQEAFTSIVSSASGDTGPGSVNLTTSTAFAWPQADPSILSSWTYLSSLTNNSRLNRIILDVFEGQIITCVVIAGFILVFLIREWVVQQQPLLIIDNVPLNRAQLAERVRDGAERVQDGRERFRRQQLELERAQRIMFEWERQHGGLFLVPPTEIGPYAGFQSLQWHMDHATERLRSTNDYDVFQIAARDIARDVEAGVAAAVDLEEFTERLIAQLNTYTEQERRSWHTMLSSVISSDVEHWRADANAQPEIGTAQASVSNGLPAQPRIPMHDPSSSPTDIKRLLQDAAAALRISGVKITPPDNATNGFQSADAPTHRPRLDPIPITNAGPDAKINIMRNVNGEMKALPDFRIEENMLAKDEAKRDLENEVAREDAMNRTTTAAAIDAPLHDHEALHGNHDNPFHPEGPEPEQHHGESFADTVASVFREEFGLDEGNEWENLRPAGAQPNPEVDHTAPDPEAPQPEQADQAQRGNLHRLADWFWGDIQLRDVPEPVPAPNEERQQNGGEDDGQEAPFVPILDRRPVAAAPPAQPVHHHHDPEVLAAAQQAGLDPEALEDPEDLEGILELIGLQGPLVGLFQTSAFCTLLVVCTIVCAVILPYVGGKLVLNLLASPVYLLVKLPLRIASHAADFIVDVALVFGGWAVMLLALATDFLLSAVEAWLPLLADQSFTQKTIDFATNTATQAGSRLASLFAESPVLAEEPAMEVLATSWALLASSVHAHASLNTIKDEVNGVLAGMSMAVTWTVETISTGSVLAALQQALLTAFNMPALRTALVALIDLMREVSQPLIENVRSLLGGEVTVTTRKIMLEPTLVYWNSTDRAYAILAGYAALAALATIYVAVDTPITRSESGKRTEKMIRDSLRQAGGVFKVILIISIEMLVFPLYCGLLLDIAFLPLFQKATVASRWAFAGRSPYTFCFVHWFVGTCYMFHFALFVGMCRKILRKGVLWFIRDPDDPTFHPVRDVLERNVATQLRKIAFSALVYGGLVILCLGGVIWTIGKACRDIFPIYWISTEPILEFPLDLFLYNFITPLIIRLFKPSDAVNTMYAWWLRRCARVLRLSHFLFDDRRKDEEGHLAQGSWTRVLPMQSGSSTIDGSGDDYLSDSFQRDGKYVLTPCNDQYRPPKYGEAFLHVDEDDAYICDKDGKKNEHFAKVYIPPWFRVRITLFMVCLWLFSAVIGLCVTLVPLVFGRHVFTTIMPDGVKVNDIYAYSLGAYVLGGGLFALLKGRQVLLSHMRQAKVDLYACIGPLQRFTIRVLKCCYVYGFIGVVLPCIFALVLQFYFILPLHTAFVSTSTTAQEPATQTSTNSTSTLTDQTTNSTANAAWAPTNLPLPSLAEHSIHILQDYALGLLYVRIASRLVIASPASKAAEAFRRITAAGYTNPNFRLATRFFVLPVCLLSALLLLLPPLITSIGLTATRTLAPKIQLSAELVTKAYRYSYPLASTCGVLALTAAELGRATSRWRARIRDEVYLVGERLHNFGEKKPPAGSRSVVRKERVSF
ncbi:hypothetical protein BDY17DRAFT_97138 [Neohortaea acidophila]|uniref:RING-type E3 ubiquitin transferase n=1 Tax=Neohortaea acidophila TaxID=245834 RepID=A0A6A6PYD0_9PEZI|nr:uncharacterized protein BDY17DRAFT_97138 [Neohortaea acidophila]KAF2485130.1 hypothetical protein BDY17DRAFT_97138 [Neohortaea acidophila]